MKIELRESGMARFSRSFCWVALYATYLRIRYGLGAPPTSRQVPWDSGSASSPVRRGPAAALYAGGHRPHLQYRALQAHSAPAISRRSWAIACGGGLLYDLGRPDASGTAHHVEPAFGDVRVPGASRSTHSAVPGVHSVYSRNSAAQAAGMDFKHSVPLMIAGVLLSTLHQSSLGSLYLIVPEKLYPLCTAHAAAVVLYLAIAVGLSMTIFESWHSSRAFGRALELHCWPAARVLAVLMSATCVRFLDLAHRGVFGCSSDRTERAVRASRSHYACPPCSCFSGRSA